MQSGFPSVANQLQASRAVHLACLYGYHWWVAVHRFALHCIALPSTALDCMADSPACCQLEVCALWHAMSCKSLYPADLFNAGHNRSSPATFPGSTATSGQPTTAPGLQGTSVGRQGRAGRSSPHPRAGRGQPHVTAHTQRSPVQQQQTAAAAASPDRHRQHPRQQRGSLTTVEPDSAVQSGAQQQQVQLLQRDAGSRPDQAETAPQAFLAAQPEQTAAGETPSIFVACKAICQRLHPLPGCARR